MMLSLKKKKKSFITYSFLPNKNEDFEIIYQL